mmetsp:Transcript_6148/g.12320  ORF Transcript_6148/g.12320 Transcript_6148/m.12320 type:complete len:763 (+) Transcript_6148:238-2526(+)
MKIKMNAHPLVGACWWWSWLLCLMKGVTVVSGQWTLQDYVTSVSADSGVTVEFQVLAAQQAVRVTMSRTIVGGAADVYAGWMAVASSPNGVMTGSTACIGGVNGQATPQLYDMGTGRSVTLSDTQNLDPTASSFVYQDDAAKEEGTATLTCQIPLDLTQGFAFTSQQNAPTTFIVAWDDDSNLLGYHQGRVRDLTVVLQPDNIGEETTTTTVVPPADSSYPTVGEEVCIEGHVMDSFCIERGTLVDNSSIRTLSPEGSTQHSVHCLVDVTRCVNSPYEILLPPLDGTDSGEDYVRGWRLDPATKETVLALARSVGGQGCTTCDGTKELDRGFHISITRATVFDEGDQDRPPLVSADPADIVISTPQILQCPQGSARSAFSTPDEQDGVDPDDNDQNLGDDAQLLELASGLTLDRSVVGNEVTFQLTYEGEAWVALAVSPSGRMVGAQAVIGLPSESNQDEAVMLYDLSARNLGGVTPAASQTILTSSSIVQQDGVTTLTFTVPLQAEGFFVAAEGDTNYLYAYGFDNQLGEHERRGVFATSLEGANVALADDPSPYYKAHGWLMALAWGLLCPLAIAASLLRKMFPSPGMFFQIHRALNSSVVMLTIVALGLAVKATNLENLDHFSEVTHRKMGLIIVLFAVMQAANGMFRPHLPHATTDDTDNQATGDNGESNSDSDNKKKSDTASAEKSTARKVWEIGHRGFGLAILILAWVNCTTGIDQYSLKFPDEGDGSTSTVAFWAIVGIVNVITLAGIVFLRSKK